MTSVATAPLRLAMIIRLVAGRGVYRVGIQVMAVVLLAAWGGTAFGAYANAVGLCTWLIFVTTAPEKAALKLLPRTRMLTAQLARLSVLTTTVPVLLVLALLVPVAVFAPDSTAATYLAAAGWFTATGALMTVCGLHRLRGVPGLDAVLFGVAAGVVLAATAATWLIRWSPQRHLLVLLAGTLLLLAVAVAALPRDWLRGRGRARSHRLLGRLTRNTWLLGMSDLLDALTTATVYLALALSGRTEDSGPLYLLLLLSAMICQFIFYQLRLAQPAASARLRGAGGTGGRARARALLGRVERFGGVFAVLFLVAAALPGVRGELLTGAGPAAVVTLGVLVCVEIALYLASMYANFLLENTNNRVLTVTSSGAGLGLLATAALAALLVPPFGAPGALAALTIAIAVRASGVRRMLIRAHPELRRPAGGRTGEPATEATMSAR